jgi:hypothetical protein
MNLLLSYKKYKEAYIATFIILLIFIYLFFRYKNVEANGVFTICRFDNYEATSDGSNTYCTIFFNGKEYNITNGMGSKKRIGKFFFVKLLKDNPTYEVIVYYQHEVPGCIDKNSLPTKGWREIPSCK